MHKFLLYISSLLLIIIISSSTASAQQNRFPIPNISVNVGEAQTNRQVAQAFEVLLLITLLSLGPSLVISLTSYVRLIIVFDFLKRGLGTQQMPPTQVMAGLALFLTIFIMMPVFQQINETAIQPYLKGDDTDLNSIYSKGVQPLRNFMFTQTRSKDIALFMQTARLERPATYDDIPTYVLVPSFMLSELKTAFNIGILVMIPFLVVDMLVSATLMAMGMIMLPPIIISLPFKIIIFILVNGWELLIGNLVKSFGR